MFNLSNVTNVFIEVSYSPGVVEHILNGFSLLEKFGYKYYEDKYINLISSTEVIDKDTIRDEFIRLLMVDLNEVIKKHELRLDYDMEIRLEEVVGIASTLIKIQTLEDYEVVNYRLHGEGSSRIKFIDVIGRMCDLSRVRLLEIVKSVSDNFIERLKVISDRREEVTTDDVIDIRNKKRLHSFFEFIGHIDCLGLQLHDLGYGNLDMEEILNFIQEDTFSQINGNTDIAQTSLDILSLLILSKDGNVDPVAKLKEIGSTFTTDLETITRITDKVSAMMNDYVEYEKSLALINKENRVE